MFSHDQQRSKPYEHHEILKGQQKQEWLYQATNDVSRYVRVSYQWEPCSLTTWLKAIGSSHTCPPQHTPSSVFPEPDGHRTCYDHLLFGNEREWTLKHSQYDLYLSKRIRNRSSMRQHVQSGWQMMSRRLSLQFAFSIDTFWLKFQTGVDGFSPSNFLGCHGGGLSFWLMLPKINSKHRSPASKRRNIKRKELWNDRCLDCHSQTPEDRIWLLHRIVEACDSSKGPLYGFQQRFKKLRGKAWAMPQGYFSSWCRRLTFFERHHLAEVASSHFAKTHKLGCRGFEL